MSEPTYGLFDKRDKLWLGDDDGPFTYTDKSLAMLAAMVSTQRIGRRIVPRPMPEGPDHLHDEITDLKMSGLEALRRVERGFLA